MYLGDLRASVYEVNSEPQQQGLVLYTFGNASGHFTGAGIC